MSNTPQPGDATLDKMRRRARITTQIFDIIDRVPILERVEILEEILEALDEVLPEHQRPEEEGSDAP